MKLQEGVLILTFVAALCLSAGNAAAQVIVSFDPPYGTTNEQVIITGAGFAPGTLVVKFNGAVDPSARATSPSTIYARVPVGATTGPITVQVNSSSASSFADFKVLGLGPYITGFDPPYGAPNTQVLIHGWHLTNATAVKFAGRNSPNFLPNAAGSQITALVPAGATNGPITVTTFYGTSNSVDSFTVIGPGPYVNGFFPPIGNAGDEVLIYGTNFTQATGVRFAGRAAGSFFVQSMSTIRVTAPQGVVSGPITVLSPKGDFTTATNFFVPPAVSGVSPASGRAGTNIMVRGQNLLGATGLTLGGVPAVSLIATNNTNLLAVVPVGAKTGPVRVNTPAGSAQTTTNFAVPPTVTGFSPPFGAPGATSVLTGFNLNEGLTSLKIGNTTAQVSTQAFSSLAFLVPNGALTGPVSVTTTNGTFVTDTNFFLPPVLTGFSASNRPPGSAITITGTNLLGASSLFFNGLPAAFDPPTNNFLLVAVVPNDVITGPITVITPAGAAQRATFYGAPRVDSFEPQSGLPGTLITIVGTNFQAASSVTLGNLPLPNFQANSNGGQITATIPTNAITGGKITVTGPAGSDTSEQIFVINLISALALTIAPASGQNVYVSSNLLLTLTLFNNGPAAAPNTLVQGSLPAGLKPVAFTVSQGQATISNQLFRADLGLLAAANTATLNLTVQAVAPGSFEPAATATSDYADPDLQDNAAAVPVTVLPLPFLSLQRYSANQILIGWPVALPDFQLQYRDLLTTNSSWLRLTTPPTTQGSNYIVIEPTIGDSRHYRLKK